MSTYYVPGPAVGTGDVTKSKVDWATVLRKFTFQRGSLEANREQFPTVVRARKKSSQVMLLGSVCVCMLGRFSHILLFVTL